MLCLAQYSKALEVGSMSDRTVPVIDISGFASDETGARDRVARAVAAACRDTGFLIISGAGVDERIVDGAASACRMFFALDEAAKQSAARPHPSHIRGWCGIGTEALAQLEHDVVPPDLKELFDVGPFDLPDNPYYAPEQAGASFAPNVWPAAAPDLRPAMCSYFRAMEGLSLRLAHIFALALDLEEDYFDDKLDRHISILRANYYPRQLEAAQANQLRAGGHTDYTAFTILWQETVAAGGLQIRDPGGTWNDVPALPGTFVVNIGDSLARWTNDTWVSTMHRVVNPPPAIAAENDRLSLVYFCQPNYDALIECIPTCQGPERPPRYPPIANGDYLAMKFAEQQTAA